MKFLFRSRVLAASLLGLVSLSPSASSAQEWPAKPVTFVVPFPPGGSLDPVARLLANKLAQTLKQAFIVDNKPGASGAIGTAMAAKAAPDGYTFLFVSDTHGVNPALYPHLPYDTMRDFAPVMLIGTAPMAIVTRADKPFKSFTEVVKASQARSESVSYGTMNGSLGHLTMAMVQQIIDARLLTVPYKGGAPLIQGAMGGEIDLAIGTPPNLIAHVRSGKLRPIAVTGDKRSAAFPDVPTLAEQGVTGASTLAWWAVFAPRGTPQPVLVKFHDELVKSLAQPDVRTTLTDTLGMDIAASSPQALNQWMLSEVSRWTKVVKDNNIRAE